MLGDTLVLQESGTRKPPRLQEPGKEKLQALQEEGAREAMCGPSAHQPSKQELRKKILSSTLYCHSLTLCQLAKGKYLKSIVPVLEQAMNLGDKTVLNTTG